MAPPAATDYTLQSAMPDPAPETPLPGKRILLAEDDPAMGELLKHVLGQEGFQVMLAKDGMAALSMIREQVPHLILSDVMLPKMDGFKLCRLIKFDSALRHIPYIFLTARTEDRDRETAMQAGANAYVTKPIQNQALVALIRKHLG